MVGQISGISFPPPRIASANGARVNQPAATPPQPSTRVTLSNASDELNAIYSISAQKLRTNNINTGHSQLDVLMGANANQPISGAFQGLGKALLAQLKDNPSDFSAAVSSTKNVDASGADKASAVALDIVTQSGVKVSVSLSRQQGGLVAEVTTTGGELTDKETDAIAGLADAFQSTLDGMSGKTPTVNVDGLTQFNTTLLKSVDLNADVRESGQSVQSLNFQSDLTQRALSYKDANGSFQLNTDLSHPELLGTLGQQDQALAAYDKQLNNAALRGYANQDMMSSFKSAFHALNSHYGSNEIDKSHQIITVTETNKAQSYLSGLADFSASFQQTDVKSNPYKDDEKDSFTYSFSQSSNVVDGVDGTRSKITQNTKSHLQASFHESLTAGTPLALSMLKSSQNYTYHQINEDSSTDTTLDFKKGRLATVGTSQSTHSLETVKTYNDALLVKESKTPNDHQESHQLNLLSESIKVKTK